MTQKGLRSTKTNIMKTPDAWEQLDDMEPTEEALTAIDDKLFATRSPRTMMET